MNYYKDKTIVITGAGAGLGKALALKMAQLGGHIIVTDIVDSSVTTTVEEIHAQGGMARGYRLDVTRSDGIETLLEELAVVDLWVNNAGVAAAGEVRDTDLSVWRKVIDVNLWGVITGTKLAYDKMLGQGHGQIVNIASMYGICTSPMVGAYAASKHGVVGITRCLQMEARSLGVKINLICPGYIDTTLFSHGNFSGVSSEDSLRLLPYRMVKLDTAVAKIIKGIEKNTPLLIFPFYVKSTWFIATLFNPLYKLISRIYLMRYRKARTPSN